jgi:hypothetical protein
MIIPQPNCFCGDLAAMNPIYKDLIDRAKKPYTPPDPLSGQDRKTVYEILVPVLRLAAELKAEGLLPSDPRRLESEHAIEFHWDMPNSIYLVARGYGPVIRDLLGCARIVVGVADKASTGIEITACGNYAMPLDEKDAIRNHAAILEGFADLVAQYRIGSNC